MKKIIYSFLALGAIVFSSCSSDPCKDKSATTLCSGKGVLVTNGSNCECSCNAGYTGTDCNTAIMPSLIKVWNNQTSSNNSPFTATTAIAAKGTSVSEIEITDLGAGYKCTNGSTSSLVITYGIIKSATKIMLDESAQCNYTFKGEGNLQADGSWKFVYTVTYVKNGATVTDNNVTILK